MIERVVISAFLIGGIAFTVYQWLLGQGVSQNEVNNAILLFMVLFENIQAINSRSESLSVFRHNLLRNKLLLFGILVAQLIHILAMYTPGLKDVLTSSRFRPRFGLMRLSLISLAAMEVYKWYRNKTPLT